MRSSDVGSMSYFSGFYFNLKVEVSLTLAKDMTGRLVGIHPREIGAEIYLVPIWNDKTIFQMLLRQSACHVLTRKWRKNTIIYASPYKNFVILFAPLFFFPKAITFLAHSVLYFLRIKILFRAETLTT